MLFKFTLDLHLLKALFLKVFVNEYSYHIQIFIEILDLEALFGARLFPELALGLIQKPTQQKHL